MSIIGEKGWVYHRGKGLGLSYGEGDRLGLSYME